MIIRTVWHSGRSLIVLPLVLLHLHMIASRAFCQEPRGEPLRLTNLDWSLDQNVVTLTYDLLGAPEKTYAVAVELKRENDPKFTLIPKSVTGHVGTGRFAGMKRTILWDYRRDVPQGLPGDGYYFEIIVKEVQPSSYSWLYYLLGGAAVAGGGVAYYLSSQQKTPSSSGTSELPPPPPRPQQ